jgi:pyridoxal phosphate enzyme (YggS family)
MTDRAHAGITVTLAETRAQIAAAARRVGREPDDVTLVAVSKSVAVERVRAALAAGVVDLGENRAQELLAKAPELVEYSPRWHFIGALQRNKVRGLAAWVTRWHTIDRAELGAEVARRAPGAVVLVEVNIAAEPQKAGVAPAKLDQLLDDLRELDLRVVGLTAVPPRGDDPRRWYADLRDLAGARGLPELSMGMTDDFEVAIEEGATIVRVGRRLFGERERLRAPTPGRR